MPRTAVEQLDKQELDKLQQRIQEEAGPVTTSWDPKLFTWFAAIEPSGGKRLMALALHKTEIRVYAGAGEKLLAAVEPKARDRLDIEIGFTRKALAIRPAQTGRGLHARIGTSRALSISCSALIRRLKQEGWPIPARLQATWDEANGMLVATLPLQEGGKGHG